RRIDEQAQIAPELDQQSDEQKSERHRHDQLRRPYGELDVDRAVADLIGTDEMEEALSHDDEDVDGADGGRHELEEPQDATAHPREDELHPDVTAEPLAIGDAHEREGG